MSDEFDEVRKAGEEIVEALKRQGFHDIAEAADKLCNARNSLGSCVVDEFKKISASNERLSNSNEQLSSNFIAHCEQEDSRWDHLIETTISNTETIKGLIETTKEDHEATRDIIKAWEAMVGTSVTLGFLAKVAKWLAAILAPILIYLNWPD